LIYIRVSEVNLCLNRIDGCIGSLINGSLHFVLDFLHGIEELWFKVHVRGENAQKFVFLDHSILLIICSDSNVINLTLVLRVDQE